MQRSGLENLMQLLERAAKEFPNQGVTIFGVNQEATIFSKYQERSNGTTFLSHQALFSNIKAESKAIQGLLNLNNAENRVVVLYTDDYLEGLHWFWAIAAGGLPCISTPLSNDLEQRRRQISNLVSLFDNPIFLTSGRLSWNFDVFANLKVFIFREIEKCRVQLEFCVKNGFRGFSQRLRDDAVLMLTSGSTGDSKAVVLKHRHILAAVKSKSDAHGTTEKDKFLNWTGLDHVASLIEIHLQALSLGADQFHVPAKLFLSSPSTFLRCISDNGISYTFAPNFFLAMLRDELERTAVHIINLDKIREGEVIETGGRLFLEKVEDFRVQSSPHAGIGTLDLSCLRALVSGGEANAVATCVSIQNHLTVFGAPASFIRPGFGMTETCAGSIYNVWDCPAYDVAKGLQLACLGKCVPGMNMRISHTGELQLRGSMVFEEYYKDLVSTKLAFTSDGWFRTGDTGNLDNIGRLCLSGRNKDMVIINGINIHPQSIENAIEDAKIPFATPTYTAVFAHRPYNSSTEAIVVVYLLASSAHYSARILASNTISKAVVTFCGVRPFKIIALGLAQLQKSSLGKLSRSKLRKAFESGEYADQIQEDEKALTSLNKASYEPANTPVQAAILESCTAVFGTTLKMIGIHNDLMQFGLSSIDLIRLKMHLQKRLHNMVEISITSFFSFSVISDLALHLELQLQKKTAALSDKVTDYDPIVTLQPHGYKTPLFLFHPGLGEVLVFMNLARYITDRPVYAIRARGFDNEPLFKDLDETIAVYHEAIKRVQPEGPYAFAGYSFGSFLAFEISKVIGTDGDEVRFLGTFDQAPFCKERTRTYDWYICVLSVAFFLDLIKEDYASSILPAMRHLPETEVLNHIFNIAPAARIEELSITRHKLNCWARMALNFKTITMNYDPTPGPEIKMDVFYTEPLIGHVKAKNTKEWFESFISRWSEVVQDVRYHEVGGGHRAMISPPNLSDFQRVFMKAMADRGV